MREAQGVELLEPSARGPPVRARGRRRVQLNGRARGLHPEAEGEFVTLRQLDRVALREQGAKGLHHSCGPGAAGGPHRKGVPNAVQADRSLASASAYGVRCGGQHGRTCEAGGVGHAGRTADVAV